MERKLTLGFSPCPNDTFIFYALAQKRVRPPGLALDLVIRDVEELNSL
ncbi:MAG TPA: 1,4-dihydroxy-6-naphthoate synthase, partial [Thermosulfidibacter takaii]|nr:1,4-dihydroxy-6-naphthoate synthase [Thermosulfidibacter takaii]